MTLPFQPAATPSPGPADKKKLIVSDYNDTLLIRANGVYVPNKKLYLFLTLAHEKGHDVFIASRGDTQSIKDVMPLHGEIMAIELPDFQVERKETVAETMRQRGYETADIVFDNDREEVYGVHTDVEHRDGYIKAHFFGEVGPSGEIASLQDLAAIIGMGDEFSQKLKTATQQAPLQHHRLV